MAEETPQAPTDRLIHQVRPPRHPPTTPEAKLPGILLLHGRGSNELDLLGLAPLFPPDCVLVSARAPLPLMGGYMWYAITDIGVPVQADLTRSIRLLYTLLDDLVAKYHVDPQRIYVLGFSQGAAMTGSLLLTVPQRLAGAAIISGYLPLDSGLPLATNGLAGRPVLVTHGTRDQVLPVEMGRQARDYLQQASADLTYHEYPATHQISEQNAADIAAWFQTRLTQP